MNKFPSEELIWQVILPRPIYRFNGEPINRGRMRLCRK